MCRASIVAEQMDVVHDDTTSINEEEEDRISNLPDDIVHRILSFLDIKYAIQTSALSKKWKHVWTSMSYLNLNNQTFGTFPQFSKFVKHVLSRRNHHTEVSAVKLSFAGRGPQFVAVVKSIVKYAYLHNVRHLTVIWLNSSKVVDEFPRCLFSSRTLEHLTLAISERSRSQGWIPKSAWDFPAIETINLSNMQFGEYGEEGLDLFSKCVNLRDLTLHRYSMLYTDFFNICAPQLSNLTITDPIDFPYVFNVVSPQLQNLTASFNSETSHVNGYGFLRLSTEGLDSLEKVNLYMYRHQIYVPQLLNLFQNLRGVKFLTLDLYVLQTLSLGLDQLSREPCPFNSLKCLKIDTLKQKDCIAEIPDEVPRKRSRQEADKDTMAKKVVKLEEEKLTMAEEKRMLEAKIKMQDGVIAEQKAMLEAMMQQEKWTSQLINCKMAELQVQVAGGDPSYELIRLIKSIMDLTPESSRVAMEAQVSCLYEEMKSRLFTSIDASEWAKIETELGITERDRSNNNVPAAVLRLVSSPSSVDVVTSSSIANAWSGVGSKTIVQPSQGSRF